MEKLKSLVAEAQTAFSRLTTREKRMVSAAGGAVAIFIVFMVLVSFSSSATAYRNRTEQKLRTLGEVDALAASYREAEQARQAVERQLTASDVKLISYLEEKGTAAGLNIPTINPKPDVPIGDGKIIESSVELTLTDITLRNLVEFLSQVETGPGIVKVKYLRVEPRPANETLTAWVAVATYRMKAP